MQQIGFNNFTLADAFFIKHISLNYFFAKM